MKVHFFFLLCLQWTSSFTVKEYLGPCDLCGYACLLGQWTTFWGRVGDEERFFTSSAIHKRNTVCYHHLVVVLFSTLSWVKLCLFFFRSLRKNTAFFIWIKVGFWLPWNIHLCLSDISGNYCDFSDLISHGVLHYILHATGSWSVTKYFN